MSRKRNTRGQKGSKGGASKRRISVDFEGVDTVSRIPEGDYAVAVKEVTVEKAQSGNDYLRFQLAVTEGPHEGKTLRHQCSLQPHALFVLRNTLEALNYPLTDSVMDINLDDLEDLEMGVAVVQEEYQGRTQSQVTETFSIDELFASDEDDEDEDYDEDEEDYEEEDEEDEEAEDEEEEEDDEEEIDLDSMKLKELKQFAKDNDIEHPAKITAKALRALIEEELDAEDEEDEEDDEEYEDYTEEELEDMDDEELIDAADEYEVKPVYTGKGKKKKLNREATIDAILDVIEEDDM